MPVLRHAVQGAVDGRQLLGLRKNRGRAGGCAYNEYETDKDDEFKDRPVEPVIIREVTINSKVLD